MASPALAWGSNHIQPYVERVVGYHSFNKKVMPFDTSQRQQREQGRRHLRTIESSEFLLDYLEGHLDGTGHALIAKDMISHNGEWLNDACQFDRKRNAITYYFDVEGLAYNFNNGHSVNGALRYSEKISFPLPRTLPNGLTLSDITVSAAGVYEYPLWMLDDAHVKRLYGRSYKELPIEMREGLTEAVIQVPKSAAEICPLSRGGASSGGEIGRDLAYSVACRVETPYNQFRASRGILDPAHKGPQHQLIELAQRKHA